MTLPTQAEILQAVQDGEAVFDWAPVPGLTGIEVMGDALKIGGLRVPVSARTTQAVADLLGLSLSTAKLEDILWQTAQVRVTPRPIGGLERRVPPAPEDMAREFGADLDQQIEAAGGRRAGEIVASVGKAWVLDEQMRCHPGRGFNYGMHSPSASLSAVTPGLRVFQDLGWTHNLDHADYSQTHRQVRLAPGATLPSVGPLTVTRTPQVAPSQTAPRPTSTGIGALALLGVAALAWAVWEV